MSHKNFPWPLSNSGTNCKSDCKARGHQEADQLHGHEANEEVVTQFAS